MKNIWFIRTDKNIGNLWDVTMDTKFIYSMHGSCVNHKSTQMYYNMVFPKLTISRNELMKIVRIIKNEEHVSGKFHCDLSVAYWLAVMDVGDIVFVRGSAEDVYVCVITGYVLESIFQAHGVFARPIKIFNKTSVDSINPKIWNRTLGRKTIERNNNKEIEDLVYEYLTLNKIAS